MRGWRWSLPKQQAVRWPLADRTPFPPYHPNPTPRCGQTHPLYPTEPCCEPSGHDAGPVPSPHLAGSGRLWPMNFKRIEVTNG